MAIEERVKSMEDELRLLKGELKQTLVNVREFLLDLKLPGPPEIVDTGDTISRGGGGRPDAGIVAGMPAPALPGRAPAEMARRPVEPPPAPVAGPVEPAMPDAAILQSHSHVQARHPVERPAPPPPAPRAAPPPREPEPAYSLPELRLAAGPIEPAPGPAPVGEPAPRGLENQEAREMSRDNTGKVVPQVNLLSNLIRWVSVARNEVGGQLPVLLDVYAVSGNLSPELKDVILHMAAVVNEKSSPAAAGDGGSEVWSKLVLELHGILTGGGTPLHLLDAFGKQASKSACCGSTAKADPARAGATAEPAPKPARLKLVLPANGEGEKEFSLAEFSFSLDPKAKGENEVSHG